MSQRKSVGERPSSSTAEDFAELVEKVQSCQLCPRMGGRLRVFGEANGTPLARVLFVAEAPGRLGAERYGIPLFGDQTGRNFEDLLRVAGIRRSEVFITNAVVCNPQDAEGRNATPSPSEVFNCSQHLATTITIISPLVVVSLGRVALNALKLLEQHSVDLSSHVASPVPWLGRFLMPMYHPGPRARVHRTFTQQVCDFEKLGGLLRKIEGLPKIS